MAHTVDPIAFVSEVRPVLASRDTPGLIRLIRSRWSIPQLLKFATAPLPDSRKVAAICLSLVGDLSIADHIYPLLADDDRFVNQMAEHALWSIWFRAASPDANRRVALGVKAMHDRQVERAVIHFDAAIETAPNFAEAYNQRAIAHYLADRYELSIADCRRAVRLIPNHFGAWAGMGHCFLHLDQLPQALQSYDRALEINPHLESLRQTAVEIRDRVNSGCR